MDFVTDKIAAVKNAVEEKKESPDYGLMKAMLDILEDVAGKQDLQTVKIDELEEELEYQNSVIKDMQQIILENFDLEELEEKHEHEHGCDCGCNDCGGECDEKHIDEFYTLQCPFCEELFFIENDELDETVDCPFCNKPVKAIDNLVKH